MKHPKYPHLGPIDRLRHDLLAEPLEYDAELARYTTRLDKQRREDEAFANTMAILMLLVLIAGSIGAVLYVLYNGGAIL